MYVYMYLHTKITCIYIYHIHVFLQVETLTKRPTVSQTIEAIQGLLYKFVGPDLYIYIHVYMLFCFCMLLLHLLPDVRRCSESAKLTQVQPFPNPGIGYFW